MCQDLLYLCHNSEPLVKMLRRGRGEDANVFKISLLVVFKALLFQAVVLFSTSGLKFEAIN